MPRKNRQIRFAPARCPQNSSPAPPALEDAVKAKSRSIKSRSGCKRCKSLHVKCDETWPVCLRCQRSGSICLTRPQLRHCQVGWHMELPWIGLGPRIESSLTANRGPGGSWVLDKRLLSLWFEHTSQIMVLDVTSNPLSYPLVDYLETSRSLVHVIQSIATGYETYFERATLVRSLEERGKAITYLREEIARGEQTLISYFLSGYLLGISATFLDDHVFDFGQEHLLAARQMIESIATSEKMLHQEMALFVIGAFVYWDMTCSILMDVSYHSSITSSIIDEYIVQMDTRKHPITGSCTYLFSLLASVGRRCRACIETGHFDVALDRRLEEDLSRWRVPEEDPLWHVTADAYRNHGLILLRRICGRNGSDSFLSDHEPDTHSKHIQMDLQSRAVRTLQGMFTVPITSSFLCLHAMPMMTAGAELTKDEPHLRAEVVSRYKALFSLNRVPASLHAIQLLQELWELKDLGIHVSWVELMLEKNWRLRLG